MNRRAVIARYRVAAAALWTPPSPDAVLTRDQVAAWLQLKDPRQVTALGIPELCLGRKTKRYLAKHVLAYLESRQQTGGAHVTRPEREEAP
jgi:hypothetical protein